MYLYYRIKPFVKLHFLLFWKYFWQINVRWKTIFTHTICIKMIDFQNIIRVIFRYWHIFRLATYLIWWASNSKSSDIFRVASKLSCRSHTKIQTVLFAYLVIIKYIITQNKRNVFLKGYHYLIVIILFP